MGCIHCTFLGVIKSLSTYFIAVKELENVIQTSFNGTAHCCFSGQTIRQKMAGPSGRSEFQVVSA